MIKLSSAARPSRPPSFLAAVLAASLALTSCTGMLLGGSSGSGRPLGGDSRSSSQASTDNAISAEVRARLGNDNSVSRFPIRVSTMNRRVTLSGTVDSYAARDQAVRVAKGVPGVSMVDNQIRVDTRAGGR